MSKAAALYRLSVSFALLVRPPPRICSSWPSLRIRSLRLLDAKNPHWRFQENNHYYLAHLVLYLFILQS